MSELPERIKHLENLVKQIKQGERFEDDFKRLYDLLKDEYRKEGGDSAPFVMGDYRHNLYQTITKQAKMYKIIKAKRPVKGAPSEYSSFVSNFLQDVTNELRHCEYRLSSSAGKDEV